MAVSRKLARCPKCGQPYEAIFKDESDTPMHLKTIGDSFLRWDIEKHVCKALSQAEAEPKKELISLDQITDEDLLQVAITGGYSAGLKSSTLKGIGRSIISVYEQKGIFHLSIPVYQYLASKGYALPVYYPLTPSQDYGKVKEAEWIPFTERYPEAGIEVWVCWESEKYGIETRILDNVDLSRDWGGMYWMAKSQKPVHPKAGLSSKEK